jgi:hypothetical protein
MDLLNGRAHRLRVAFLDRPFSLNPTGRCFVPPITLSILKNADRSAMARTGCCMPPGLAIAVHVNCAPNARKALLL